MTIFFDHMPYLPYLAFEGMAKPERKHQWTEHRSNIKSANISVLDA